MVRHQREVKNDNFLMKRKIYSLLYVYQSVLSRFGETDASRTLASVNIITYRTTTNFMG